MEKLLSFFHNNNLDYVEHVHQAVYTVEDAKATRATIKGLHCKNLFLKNKKSTKHFLFTVQADKPVRLNEIRKILNVNRISLGKEENLLLLLNTTPGSVSALNLIHDENNQVQFIIDREVWEANRITLHPNNNSRTWELTREVFHRFLELINHKPKIIDTW